MYESARLLLEDDSSVDESVSAGQSTLPSTSNMSALQPTILDGKFFELLPDTSGTDKIVAICKKCLPNKVQIKGSRSCTSNFKTHLKRKHGQETIQEYQEYIKSKRSKNVRTSSSSNELSPRRRSSNVPSYSQAEFDRDIVKYFVNSMISLKCTEDSYFRQILRRLNTGANDLRIMSRRTLGRMITEFFDEETTLVKQELNQVKHVCTTVDIWSGRRRSFLGVTVHWIDSHNLKRVSRALACQRFKGTHSYDKIYELLQDIYKKYGLTSTNVVACVTDNGSNFVKAFKSFGVHRINVLNEQNTIDSCDEDSDTDSTDDELTYLNDLSPTISHLETRLPLQLRCASHTLSLCATDANKILENQETELSKMHDQTIKKCNTLWKAANRPKSAEILQNILGHTLSRPVETRWNSLYDALKKIATIEDKSATLHRALNIKNPLRESDFTYIKEYLSCTQPIADALDILQGENATYYGIFLPTILSLKKKLTNLTGTREYEYCSTLTETYLKSVQTRFKDFLKISGFQAENAALAALSHPKYKKLKWTSLIGQSEYSIMKNLLVKEVVKIIPNQLSRENPSMRSREDDYFEIDSSSGSDNQSSEPRSKAELVVTHFLAEDSRELEILNNHKEIKKIFLKFNTPLPSSAPVERMFSYATMINCPKANRLSDEMFEKRVILKVNLNYKSET